MNTYFTNLMNTWLANNTWTSQLTPREPIVYIAAGVFGILLLICFVASILAVVFMIKRHSDTSAKHYTEIYEAQRDEAVRTVIVGLRSAKMPDEEIKETLMKEYLYDAAKADSLIAHTR